MKTKNWSKVFDVVVIIAMVQKNIRLARELKLIEPDKKSGCITIIDKYTGNIILKFNIDEINDEKFEKYFEYSEEKGKRLYENLANGHVASYQSRDPKTGKWGGAIVAGDYILSFSGLPERVDETLMLLLAAQLELISFNEAIEIAKLTENDTFRKLSAAVITDAHRRSLVQ